MKNFGLEKFLCRRNILRVSKFLKGPISPNQCVFLGSEFLENGSRSFWFQWRVCFACKNEIRACHKDAQHKHKSHEPYSERLYNRALMKGITEVRKLIWFQCMLLFWNIIGADFGHFEGGIFKAALKLFCMNRYQWALWGLICI